MPKLNYSLQDIDALADKDLVSREERMLIPSPIDTELDTEWNQ